MRTKHVNTPYYCTYQVSLKDSDYSALSGELDEILRDTDIKDIVFSSRWKEEKINKIISASKNNDAGLAWQKLKGRIHFTESEIQNRENCVIAAYSQGGGSSALNPGDEISCGGLGEFHVVGVGTFNSDYYIPSTLFEALRLPVQYIDIILAERLPMEEHQPFMNKLSAIPGAEQVIPAYGVANDIRYFSTNLLEIFILYIFSITALLFLIQYITSINRKMDAISELVGARRGTIAFFLLLERFVIALAASVLAIAIHKIFYNSIFERFNLTSTDYAWRDYSIITAIVILSSVLASVPFVISYARRSALKVLRK
ncbi:MAG: hypothetical protein ACLSVG_01100 [Clostridia bacterium]